MDKTRVLVVGAGQVGMGTLEALLDKEEFHHDVEVVGVATRRPEKLKGISAVIYPYNSPEDLKKSAGKVDVAVICNASQALWYHSPDGTVANEEGPKWIDIFNVTVDSFDNHRETAEYFEAMTTEDHLACFGFGWDPGKEFSPQKHVKKSSFPRSATNLFYGPGMSQGHSTALRTDPLLKQLGVVDAVQFTMPREETLERVRAGEMKEFSPGERMWRDCYIQLDRDSDMDAITKHVQEMPGYFVGYETKVTSVSADKMGELRQRKGHQGVIMTVGKTRGGSSIVTERRLTFENNAQATGCFLAEATVAGNKAYQEGRRGVVVPGDLGENLFSCLTQREIIGRGL